MKIRTYYTALEQQTADCLAAYPGEAIQVQSVDPVFGYVNEFLAPLWVEGDQVIIVEQDIVFHEGAIEEIWNCSEPICLYGYNEDDHFDVGCAYFGCTKISAAAIEATQNVWTELQADRRFYYTASCDFTKAARAAGLSLHMHTPHVTNL